MNMKDFITLLKSYHIEDDFNLIKYVEYYDPNATGDVERLNNIIAKVAAWGIGFVDEEVAAKAEKTIVCDNAGRFIWNVVARACDCRLIDVPEAAKMACDGWWAINGFGDRIDECTMLIAGTNMDGKEFRESLGLIATHRVQSEQNYLIPYLDAINSEENAEYHFNQKTPLEQLTTRLPVSDDSWDYMTNPG